MKIVLCQNPIVWENPIENIAICNRIVNEIFKYKDSGIDIIVFPEFFTYGFTMNENVAENAANGISISWLREKSKEYQVAIAASIPVIDGDKLFNRAFFVVPDGSEYTYNKRHLFSYGGEDTIFTSGNSRTIFSYKGWNISLQICYDIRFPVWSRNRDLSYDLIINMANWPSLRDSVIEPLARARAIENQCYYAFDNRSGNDLKNKYNTIGLVSDFKGELLNSESCSNEFNYKVFDLDIVELKSFRDKFKAWKDADKFDIIL